MFEYINLYINLKNLICVLTSFDYFTDVSFLNQWKTLKKRISIMIRLIKNILIVAFAEVFYKKLFFIASR